MCGTPQYKWDEDKNAFEPQEIWCKGCYLKDISNEKEDTLPGTTVRLIPRAEAERIQGELANGWGVG